MADLLSHGLVAYLLAGPRTDGTSVAWAVSGALLPDLLDRAPNILWRLSLDVLRVEPSALEVLLLAGLQVFHTPIGFALLAIAIALSLPLWLVDPLKRRTAALCLWLGGMSHFALDICQEDARLRLFYPFSMRFWQFGFMQSEDSIRVWPVLLIAALVLWRLRQPQD